MPGRHPPSPSVDRLRADAFHRAESRGLHATIEGVDPANTPLVESRSGMSRGEDDCPPHDEVTRRNGLGYCFSAKHHRRDDRDDAQWAHDLTRGEECAIFDLADSHDLADPSAAAGNRGLYGL